MRLDLFVPVLGPPIPFFLPPSGGASDLSSVALGVPAARGVPLSSDDLLPAESDSGGTIVGGSIDCVGLQSDGNLANRSDARRNMMTLVCLDDLFEVLAEGVDDPLTGVDMVVNLCDWYRGVDDGLRWSWYSTGVQGIIAPVSLLGFLPQCLVKRGRGTAVGVQYVEWWTCVLWNLLRW